jgi:UDPglucose--hexose-1-phosphate uridylyltransferase
MELRKDYILDRWVYVATGRGKRKHELKEVEIVEDSGPKSCFFCPGNESLTPAEKGRVEEDGKWTMRWFDNKFAAVEQKGDYKIKTANTFFTYSDAWGVHEIIVETDDHKKQLWDLDKAHIKKLFQVYSQRIKELEKIEGIAYVDIFKNHGPDAGTSLVHSHSQIIALSMFPDIVKRKISSLKKFGDDCPYCHIINIEKDSYRKCFENNTIVAFCPYASRFNYEIAIFPKRHVKKLDNLTDEEMTDLAEIFTKILSKLKQLNHSYNFYIQYSPEGENLHLQIEICPRIAVRGGFEYSTQYVINTVSPEDAAKFYRGESES